MFSMLVEISSGLLSGLFSKQERFSFASLERILSMTRLSFPTCKGIAWRPAENEANQIMRKIIQQPKVVKRRLIKIQSKKAYELTMKEIDALMKKGEKNLRPAELKTLRTLAEAAETYEDKVQPLPVPESLPDIVRYKLLQLHINQGFAARLLGVSDAKFSLIMNGKQKPDIYFIKAVHDKLEVDANVLLKAI